MKILGQLSPQALPLVVAVSLVLFAGGTYAAGPAGGGTVGGVSGMAAGPAGGGRAGGASMGAMRGGISPGRAISGARPGVSFSNNAGQHLGNGTFTRGGALRGTGFSPSGLSLPYHNVQNNFAVSSGAVARGITVPSAGRPANAWSGMAVNTANNGNFAVARGVGRPAYRANNNWSATGYTGNANGFTGQRLNPGAPGANLPTYNQGNYGDRGGYSHRNGNYRIYNRNFYYPYAYGPYYAPYVNYFGGYYGGYGGAYPYYNDIPSLDTTYENSAAATVTPQYTEPVPVTPGVDQPDNAPPSDQPTPQRQQTPSANGAGTIPNNGPDSLVEAVQEELVRRGYYGGKVDAMFSPDTKEALRKFQADRHLAATGLINEATLHALQLD